MTTLKDVLESMNHSRYEGCEEGIYLYDYDLTVSMDIPELLSEVAPKEMSKIGADWTAQDKKEFICDVYQRHEDEVDRLAVTRYFKNFPEKFEVNSKN